MLEYEIAKHLAMCTKKRKETVFRPNTSRLGTLSIIGTLNTNTTRNKVCSIKVRLHGDSKVEKVINILNLKAEVNATFAWLVRDKWRQKEGK